MRVEKRDGYRVVVGGPVPPQADAITLGKTIVTRKNAHTHSALMAHELVHVRQFKDLGSVRFVLGYVGSYLRFRMAGYGHMAAYRRIPLEVEASWVSRHHTVAELEPAGLSLDAMQLQQRLRPVTATTRKSNPRPAPIGRAWNRSRTSTTA